MGTVTKVKIPYNQIVITKQPDLLEGYTFSLLFPKDTTTIVEDEMLRIKLKPRLLKIFQNVLEGDGRWLFEYGFNHPDFEQFSQEYIRACEMLYPSETKTVKNTKLAMQLIAWLRIARKRWQEGS